MRAKQFFPPLKFLLSISLVLWKIVSYTDNQNLCRVLENVRKFLCLWVVVCGLFVVASPKSYAQLGAMLVHDTQGDQEKAVSLMIQGVQKHYKSRNMQRNYSNMQKNSKIF